MQHPLGKLLRERPGGGDHPRKAQGLVPMGSGSAVEGHEREREREREREATEYRIGYNIH